MKKIKQIHKVQPELTPLQTLQFLEDFRNLVHNKDAKTLAISLRVPENVLNVFKIKAKKKRLKYQSVIVQLMREWLQENVD